MAGKRSTLPEPFEKKWKGGRWHYAPRRCPYCKNGSIQVGGEWYECAPCGGTSYLFRDGHPDTDEKLLAAAPDSYRDHVRKWSKAAGVRRPKPPA